METIVKTMNVEKMKVDIKAIAEEQKFLRNQRKSVYIIGERKMPEWEAENKHRSNREKLRVMYAAYGIARGKCYSQIENHYQEENHPLKEHQLKIDRILKTYEIQTKGE